MLEKGMGTASRDRILPFPDHQKTHGEEAREEGFQESRGPVFGDPVEV